MFICNTIHRHSGRNEPVQIKKYLKSNFVIKAASTKKYRKFSVVNEWNTKEDIGKSMKNASYVLWYAKRYLLGRSNIEQ